MGGSIEHDYAPSCELYERLLRPTLFEPYVIDLAHRVADLTEGSITEGSVLEMACGTGILTRQLRTQLKPSMPLTATDINLGMLQYAQSKLKDLNAIEWKEADIANLPFRDGSFSTAVCPFGLMFVSERDRAFREMRRVLVNGGRLAVSVWDCMEANPWGVAVHDTVMTLFLDNPPQFFKAPFIFADVELLRGLLSANGFDQITIQAVPMECYSSSAESLAVGMIEGGPLLAEIQQGGSPEPVVNTVATAFARLGGNSPFRTTMQAIAVTARARG
ncbi:MAG: methyltransferase domain-containing protein [Nitrospira sp.]|nr:methyltransferase domain-containing protein [Nitrospira sp.]